MNIGIDIDDTITNTYELNHAYAQKFTIETLGRSGDIKQITDSATHFYMAYMHGWTFDETKEFFRIYYKDIIKDVLPKVFAVQVIKKLRQEGHKIYLITARFDGVDGVNSKEETLKWLKKYDVQYDELITNAKEPKYKLQQCKNKKIDIFVDDTFDNCKKVSDAGIKTYIMDSSVNRDINDKNIRRIYSWPHFYQVIKEEC